MKSTNQRQKQYRLNRLPFIKAISLILCIALCPVTLCACDLFTDKLYEQPTEDAPAYGTVLKTPADSIRLGWFENSTMNPYFINANLNYDLVRLMYQSLYKTDSVYVPYAQLAESFRQESDKKVTVTVRGDIFFSDGTRLSAKDVVYSFNKAKESDMYSSSLKNITSLYASSNKLTVTLAKPDKYVQNILDFPVVKSGTAENADSKPVGTGMYMLRNNTLIFNTYYKGTTPDIGTIELVPVSESSTFALALESGSIDAIFDDLASGKYTRVAASSAKVNLNNLVYIGMNCSHSVTGMAAVRQAVNYSVNRTDICDNCFDGFAVPAFTVFNPRWSEYFSGGIDESGLALNYSQASKLLKDSGFPVCYLKLIVNADNEFKVTAARRLAAGMKNSGFGITVSELGRNEYFDALQSGDYDLYIGEMKFADDMDMTALFETYGVAYSSPSAAAYEKYRTGAMTMAEFLRIFEADVPFAPVCYRQGVFTYTRNITTQVDASYDDLFANIADWAVSRSVEQ